MIIPTRIRTVTVLLLLAASPFAWTRGLAPDTINGVWRTASGGYIQIYAYHGHYVGIVVGVASGQARYDDNNPDKSKRGRRLLGVELIHDLESVSGNSYKGGTVYDPDNGKTYNLKGELVDHDTLKLRGYIGFSLFGRSQTWDRINPQRPAVSQDTLHWPIPAGPKSG